MWQPIETAPKDRTILLWFPDGPFACPAKWERIEGGDEDGNGGSSAWMIADDLSEQHDGVVWEESAQPTLWTEVPAYVPRGCLLGGVVVMAEVSAGRSPCWGCNGPREVCGGKPKLVTDKHQIMVTGPFRSVSGGGDSYMDAHLAYPQETDAPKCDHPACWGPCAKCGAHVHENEHWRFCPNCGKV